MAVSEERHPIAQVTRESRDGWRRFAKQHGVNTTALVEVIGLYLGTLTGPAPEPFDALVRDAVELAEERSRRSDD